MKIRLFIRSHLLVFAEMKIQLTFTCLIATREECRSTVGSSQVLGLVLTQCGHTEHGRGEGDNSFLVKMSSSRCDLDN